MTDAGDMIFLSDPPRDATPRHESTIPLPPSDSQMTDAIEAPKMTPEPDLLPCPFCGVRPSYAYKNKIGGWHSLLCLNDACFAAPEVVGNSQPEIIERWNTRAPLP